MSDLSPELVQAAAENQAAPQSVDVAALLARIQAVEAQAAQASAAAAAAQAAAEPKQPTLAVVVVNVADSGARHALLIIGEELDAIRAHVGL